MNLLVTVYYNQSSTFTQNKSKLNAYLTGIPNSFHRHHVKMNQNKKHQFKKRLNKNWSKSKLNIIFLGM